MDTYVLIIATSVVIVLSFFFNILARKTNFPSVLLLIFLGFGVKYLLKYLDVDPNFFPVLEVLGVVGLIMIVLEAALDLELKKEKSTLILKSMLIAFLGLMLTSISIAFIIKSVVAHVDFLTSLIYAIPLGIMSSAVIIPSVINMDSNKKEFMIYESTFSDIFGIMFFYYVLGNVNAHSFQEVAINVSTNLVSTVFISLIIGYIMVWGLQALKTRTKFFLILAILILLYSIGKLMHISSLLIILIFGLILNNRKLFFRNKLSKLISNRGIERLLDDFKMFTAETAFLVRTFFFVFFGMSLSLETFLGANVWILGGLVLLSLYGIRFVIFKIVSKKNIFPEVWIAPRGLISILLFYAIPEDFLVSDMESGVLFIVIISTSIVMALSLIMDRRRAEREEDPMLPIEQ